MIRMKKPPSPVDFDPYLEPYAEALRERYNYYQKAVSRLTGPNQSPADFASGHEYFGLHFTGDQWIFREWAPNATGLRLIGDFNNWRTNPLYQARRITESGQWEISMPRNAIQHGQSYRLHITWPGGEGERIPSYARRVVHNPATDSFNAQVWRPESAYKWKHPLPRPNENPAFIYEAHVGIASEEPRVATYREFTEQILPRIAAANYNTLQLMAIQEHPYYGSFGYHVTNFFAPSSRFGTPDELKELIDTAHSYGIAVVLDLVHSHAAKNAVEGLGLFDGTGYQYFHAGGRGYHDAWDSYCFDYSKPEVLHFLLSNCRYWLDEFRVDGFRFDGITSMLYTHHGLGAAFSSYDDYFNDQVDLDAMAYLALANQLIHELNQGALTIAEDVSGMPALTSPLEHGGCGFDCRLAMGIPDYWFEILEVKDEDWNMDELYHRVTDHRPEETVINYAEAHDQAIVGGKTLIFNMVDADMYTDMARANENINVERGVALHKMIRLATISGGGSGYLNFMGNEFGHPEWVDFPRAGNNWSCHYARRQWSLADNPELLYSALNAFDRDMIKTCAENNILAQPQPDWQFSNTPDNVAAWMRGDFVFVFNWHPGVSYTDYHIPLPAGEYQLLLNTDKTEYAGHNRLVEEQKHYTIPGEPHAALSLYLPTRTGLILIRTAEP